MLALLSVLITPVASAQIAPLDLCASNSRLSSNDDCTCDSMFALELANDFGLTSCDADHGVPCIDNGHGGTTCTANEFGRLVYDDPMNPAHVPGPVLLSPLATQNLEGRPAPRCADGSDTCAPGTWVRCVDGTRPVYWVDWAADGSDDWVFTFQGGGSCGRSNDFTGGEACWGRYAGVANASNPDAQQKREDMTGWELAFDQTGTDALIGPMRFREGEGIHRWDAPLFSDYNRVYVPKCTFDRGNGQAHITGFSASNCPAGWDCSSHKPDPDTGSRPSTGTGDTFYLPFTGRDLISAILNDLDAPDGTDPDLSDADLILFAGHSGGGQGLIHNLDSLAAEANTLAPQADVRGLLDARGWPTLNHIVAAADPVVGLTLFDTTSDGNMSCAGCLPEGVSPTGDPVNGDVSAASFRVNGDFAVRGFYHDTEWDQSCMAHVPVRQAWRCRAAGHVMWNHLQTPFFVRQAVEDSRHVGARPPEFADDPDWLWPTPDAYRFEVVSQIRDVQAWANGAASSGPLEPDAYAWMDPSAIGLGVFYPDSDSHPGFFKDDPFATEMAHSGTFTTCWSYEQVLHRWLTGAGDTVFIAPAVVGALFADRTCP